MDKITLIVNIVKSSILFDNDFKKGKYPNLQEYNNMIQTYLDNLKTLSTDARLVQLCSSLHNINSHILKSMSKKTKLDKTKNTVIFFYKPDCEPSLIFANEWVKLREQHNKKYNMIAINCDNPKYTDICNFFKIYEYPTIKLVKPYSIDDYFGSMDAVSITNDLLNE